MSRRPVMVLVGIVLVVLVWSAIGPRDTGVWFLETVWVIIGLPLILLWARRDPLTAVACVLLAIHAIVLLYGGHYGYAYTPVGVAVQDAFDLTRNPYDRLGHFLQGFVPAIVIREVLWRRSPLADSRWLSVLTVCACVALSAIWELLEWAGAYLVAGGDPAFLGGQGDPWDTQWDMLLALLGAITALIIFHRLHDRQLVATATQQRSG